MKNENICKFISSASHEMLETHSFVLESDTDVMLKTKVSEHHRLILGISGSCKITVGADEFDFRPGSIIFIFQGEAVSIIPDDNCKYMYICFSGMRSDTLFRRFGISKLLRSFTGYEGLIPLWKESISRSSPDNADITSEGILLYTLSRLDGLSPGQNSLINNIVQYTQQSFSNPELSVLHLSEKFNYSSKYISHLFKERMGVGYSEYLRDMRIKYAVSLLDHGIDSIKNIAFLTGFSDPLYFSTVFKKAVGLSPKEYKKAQNK